MQRRSFLWLSASLAAGSAIRSQAQQSQPARRIGVLSYLGADDPEAKLYAESFVGGLRERGWIVDRNVQVEFRWANGNADLGRKYAAQLAAMSPDLVLVAGGLYVRLMQQASRTVPIVFVQTTDPVGAGLVASLARPGGNTTGFTQFEFDICAKWLELLKQVTPSISRVGVLRDPSNPAGTGLFGAIQAAAPTYGVEVSPVGLQDIGEIERGVSAFASGSRGGLVITPSGLAIVNRDAIIDLAAQYRLPAIYPFRNFAVGGGLLSYGPDVVDQYRRAAGYVDRVLKGEKPADLPVQRATKFELVVNLKTAKALGLTIPQSVMLRVDESIQ